MNPYILASLDTCKIKTFNLFNLNDMLIFGGF